MQRFIPTQAGDADKSKGYEEIDGSVKSFYNQMVVHHSGNATNNPSVKQVQEEEMENGYADIAYHFAIDQYGNIYEGRPLNIKGAHVKGQTRGIGIVLLSDLDAKDSGLSAAQWAAELIMGDGNLSDPMVQSLINLTQYLRKEHNIKYLGAHKEVHKEEGTSRNCPGNVGMELIELIRKAYKFYNPGN